MYDETPHVFSTHTAGEPPQPPKTPSKLPAVIAGLIGGLVVAVVFAILVLTGLIGGEKTIVPSAGFGVSDESGDLPTVNAVYRKIGKGVVNIQAKVSRASESPFGGAQQGTATGSGFVVDKDGTILTNAHVVDGASQITVHFGDEKSVPAKLVGSDNSNDLAVLKVDVDEDDLQPLELADSSKVEVGSPVIAIGNPFGLDRTVTTGIVLSLIHI